VLSRTNSIARTFDRVCSVLTILGYLDGERVTEPGRRLARIYSELDLVAAECLREGVWDGLGPADLACAASLLVYEARMSDDAAPPRVPKGPAREAIERTLRIWLDTHNIEADYDLDFQREPDTGFAWAAYRWASGHRLEAVLDEAGLTAGDFVRWCKQLIDLLGQIADAAAAGRSTGVRESARGAVDLIRRGVVAYTSMT
jgi:ATP-dependent RNA helicase HelY